MAVTAGWAPLPEPPRGGMAAPPPGRLAGFHGAVMPVEEDGSELGASAAASLSSAEDLAPTGATSGTAGAPLPPPPPELDMGTMLMGRKLPDAPRALTWAGFGWRDAPCVAASGWVGLLGALPPPFCISPIWARLWNAPVARLKAVNWVTVLRASSRSSWMTLRASVRRRGSVKLKRRRGICVPSRWLRARTQCAGVS